MGKYNVPGFCAHCGTVERAHHPESKRCMKDGVRALFGSPQRWGDTFCEIVLSPQDRVRNAAPDLLEALKLFTSASIGGGNSRGESYIGWQTGDGLTASQRISIAKAAIAKASGDTALSTTQSDTPCS